MASEETFDLVIVGSGCASVTAALAAKSLGGSALIIEKQALFGGSSAYSGGILWIPNNPLLDDDSEEASRAYLNAIVGEPSKASPMVKREAFLREGPRAIQFLLDQGVNLVRVFWPDYYSSAPGGHEYGRTVAGALFDINELGEWRDKLGVFYGFPALPVGSHEFVDLTLAKRTWKGRIAGLKLGARMAWDKLTGQRRRGSGNAIQGRLLQAALKAEIPIRMETELIGIETEGSRVTGVRVRDAKGEHVIKASRGVLLNAGGFSRNLKMREQFQPKPTSVDWTQVNPGDTGEVMQKPWRSAPTPIAWKKPGGPRAPYCPTANTAASMSPAKAASRTSSSSARTASESAMKPAPIWNLARRCMPRARCPPSPSSIAGR